MSAMKRTISRDCTLTVLETKLIHAVQKLLHEHYCWACGKRLLVPKKSVKSTLAEGKGAYG
jgi:hypothetical protein